MQGAEHKTLDLDGGVTLHYREKGSGRPVLFVHGVWGSARFFDSQVDWFGDRYRAIALDLRGHGRSTMTSAGHTVPTYARDLHAFLGALDLEGTVVIGWSMGAFVLWDCCEQFGTERIAASVVVDQAATDFRFDDFPLGMISFDMLRDWMAATQTDRVALVESIAPAMFKERPLPADLRWICDEMTRAPEVVAGAILFDQSVRDYRRAIDGFPLPTLLCFGADESLQSLDAARQLASAMQDAQLEVFAESGHCPFLEEPERFNAIVDAFIRGLAS